MTLQKWYRILPDQSHSLFCLLIRLYELIGPVISLEKCRVPLEALVQFLFARFVQIRVHCTGVIVQQICALDGAVLERTKYAIVAIPPRDVGREQSKQT